MAEADLHSRIEMANSPFDSSSSSRSRDTETTIPLLRIIRFERNVIDSAHPPRQIQFENYKDIDDDEKWDPITTATCKICHDQKIQCVFQPCGHACSCRNCAKTTLENKDLCPICREQVDQVSKYRKQILITDDEEEHAEQEKKRSRHASASSNK